MVRAGSTTTQLPSGHAAACPPPADVGGDALAPGALPWLGEAEWPFRPPAPVDRQARLFRLEEGSPRA